MDDEINDLRDTAFKMKLIVQSHKIGIWDYDIKKDIFSYPGSNSQFFQNMNWSQYLDFIHPDDRIIPAEAMENVKQGKQNTLESCYRFRVPSTDQYRWFEIVAVVYIYDKDGKPWKITGLRWDVTDEISDRQRVMDNKAILELTFKAADIIPWEFDIKNMTMLSNNPNSVFYKGGNVGEFIETMICNDYKDIVYNKIQRLINKETEVLNLQIPIDFHDRKEWVNIIGKVVDDPSNRTCKAIGVTRFITKEIEKQQELIELREKAERSNKLKSTFLANMTHDIRTPLNAIVGFSRLIAETEDKEEVKEFCRVIEVNNEMLLQLVNDILDISRIEAGLMEFNISDIDICDVFGNLQNLYQYKMPEGVELIDEIPDRSMIINTDPNRFMQVISNFMNNAIKFTSSGSITMGYSHIDGGLKFFVRDTGKGIDNKALDSIFDRFVKLNSDIQGSGIGLSICSTIVDKFGGQIGVESEVGKGSEFWFTLPLGGMLKMDNE